MKQLFLCSYFAGVKNLFSDYAKEGDKVNIITTFPLTKDENWTKMENGGFVFFKNGDKIAEVVGTPKEAIDDGTLGDRAA